MIIREYTLEDRFMVEDVYQRAFTCEPWHENLSPEYVRERWGFCMRRRGFQAFVAVGDERQVTGFSSFDTPTMEEVVRDRGNDLAAFAARVGRPIVWLSETCVAPAQQGRGIARRLKTFVLSVLSNRQESLLVLTRHREDNARIIRLSRSFGFAPTGIRTPSSQVAGVSHEYWYRIVPRKEKS